MKFTFNTPGESRILSVSVASSPEEEKTSQPQMGAQELQSQTIDFVNQINDDLFHESAKDAVSLTKGMQLYNHLSKGYFEASQQILNEPLESNDVEAFQFVNDKLRAVKAGLMEEALKGQKPEIQAIVSQAFNQYTARHDEEILTKNKKNEEIMLRDTIFSEIQDYKANYMRSDSMDIDLFGNQVSTILNTGVAANLLTEEQAVDIFEQSIREIGISDIRKTMQVAPDDAIEAIQDVDFMRGLLSNEDRATLLGEAQEALFNHQRDLEVSQVQDTLKSRAEPAIEAAQAEFMEYLGTATPEQRGAVRDMLMAKDQKDFDNAVQKFQQQKLDRTLTRQEIIGQVLTGKDLNSYSKDKIDDAFRYQLALKEQKTQQRATIVDQAILATKWPERITSFQNELSDLAKTGKLEEADQILQAYSYSRETESKSLDKLDKKAHAILAMAYNMSATTNLPPNEALRRARENFNDPMDEQRVKKLERDFIKEELDYADLANSFFDDRGFSSYFTDIDVDETTRNAMKDTLKAFYIDANGDMDTAKTMAADTMRQNFGHSTITNTKRIMYRPIEKLSPVFKRNMDLVREDLLESVRAGTGQEYTLDDISIHSSPLTGRTKANGKVVHEYLVFDKTGTKVLWDEERKEPLTWYPDVDDVNRRLLERSGRGR